MTSTLVRSRAIYYLPTTVFKVRNTLPVVTFQTQRLLFKTIFVRVIVKNLSQGSNFSADDCKQTMTTSVPKRNNSWGSKRALYGTNQLEMRTKKAFEDQLCFFRCKRTAEMYGDKYLYVPSWTSLPVPLQTARSLPNAAIKTQISKPRNQCLILVLVYSSASDWGTVQIKATVKAKM